MSSCPLSLVHTVGAKRSYQEVFPLDLGSPTFVSRWAPLGPQKGLPQEAEPDGTAPVCPPPPGKRGACRRNGTASCLTGSQPRCRSAGLLWLEYWQPGAKPCPTLSDSQSTPSGLFCRERLLPGGSRWHCSLLNSFQHINNPLDGACSVACQRGSRELLQESTCCIPVGSGKGPGRHL